MEAVEVVLAETVNSVKDTAKPCGGWVGGGREVLVDYFFFCDKFYEGRFLMIVVVVVSHLLGAAVFLHVNGLSGAAGELEVH